jgi:hypothetical protein
MHLSQKGGLLDEIEKEVKKLQVQYPGFSKQLKNILGKIRENNYVEDSWESFRIHFEKVHPSFFNKLYLRCPELNNNHLKHCAYLRIGLGNKQVAGLLNISIKGVEMARYRIKKKLKLNPDESLMSYIQSV